MAEPKVVITDMMADDLAPEREALGAGIRLEALDARREEDLAGRVEDAHAVIVYQLDVLESEPPAEDDPLIRAWRDPGHPAHLRVVLTS